MVESKQKWLRLVYTHEAGISIRWNTQAQWIKILAKISNPRWRRYTPPSWKQNILCAFACVIPVYTNISGSTRKRNDFLFLCMRFCLRLCFRRPGLHVGFLCLCLRRTCKPAFMYKDCLSSCRPFNRDNVEDFQPSIELCLWTTNLWAVGSSFFLLRKIALWRALTTFMW